MKTFLITTLAFCLFALTCSAQWQNGTNMYNLNTGNVGIGTTTPDTKLSVVDTTRDLQIRIGYVLTKLNPNVRWTGRNQANNTSRHADIQLDADAGVFNFFAPATATPSVKAISILTGGNVGVGTTTPATILDAVAATTTTGIRSVNSAAAGSTAGGGLLAVTGNPSVAGQRLGLLGFGGTIGNGTYSYASQIVGYSSEAWTTTSGSILTFRTTNSGSTTSSEKMRIDNAGNVGIGTTHPDQKLTVNGQIHSTSVLVESTVPADYVFNADYNLRPLADVKAYVDKNHHLPEVPSAAEFKKDGQNLGEMNMLLLKKVEELTLYMIEQNKATAELTKTVKAQQEEIERLKKGNN